MSRGLGRVQVAILDHLHARRGDNHIGGPGEPLFILGPGIHDMRHVAEEMTRQRGSLNLACKLCSRALFGDGGAWPLRAAFHGAHLVR